MTDLLSSYLLTTALFLPGYRWQSFISSAVWSDSPRKEEESGEGEGLQRLSKAACAGKLAVLAGDTGADHGLVASF